MTQADLKDPSTTSMETLCHNLNHMRTQEDAGSLCDFSLVCNGRVLPCHKAVLAARSDYFKTLFARHDFKENDTNEMKLTEDEHMHADAFLAYVYGNYPKWDRREGPDEAVALFRMADKYLMEDLKDICKDWLVGYADHAPLEDCKDIFRYSVGATNAVLN